MTTKCVDISYWQGKVSVENFKRVKASGINHIIFRTSYTSQSSFSLSKDSVFENNIKNAVRAGIKNFGVYHYSQAISVSEAQREARYCLGIIKPYKQHINMGVFFDWEFGGRLNSSKARSLGRAACTKMCNAWAEEVKAQGYKYGTYASLSVFNNYLNAKDIKGRIWVAQYNSTCSYKGEKYMWQYSSDGRVNGLSGRIDMNYVYSSSTGTELDEQKVHKLYTGVFPKLPIRGYFKRGDKGSQVKYLQLFLNWYGDYGLVVDGVIGTKTLTAVEKFQKSEGIAVDGLFGRTSLKIAKVVRK